MWFYLPTQRSCKNKNFLFIWIRFLHQNRRTVIEEGDGEVHHHFSVWANWSSCYHQIYFLEPSKKNDIITLRMTMNLLNVHLVKFRRIFIFLLNIRKEVRKRLWLNRVIMIKHRVLLMFELCINKEVWHYPSL